MVPLPTLNKRETGWDFRPFLAAKRCDAGIGAVRSTAAAMLMPKPIGPLGLVGEGVGGRSDRPKPEKLGVDAFFRLKNDFFSGTLRD